MASREEVQALGAARRRIDALTQGTTSLRGQDLNLRPSGYEEAERSLLGLMSL
jgi:hypothetical protein